MHDRWCWKEEILFTPWKRQLVGAELLAEERMGIARCAGGEIAESGVGSISFGLCDHLVTVFYVVA